MPDRDLVTDLLVSSVVSGQCNLALHVLDSFLHKASAGLARVFMDLTASQLQACLSTLWYLMSVFPRVSACVQDTETDEGRGRKELPSHKGVISVRGWGESVVHSISVEEPV